MRVTAERLRREFAETYAPLCLKIKPKGGGGLIPFRLKPVQLKVLEAIAGQRARGVPPRIIILKARQMGFSTLTQGLLFHDSHTNAHRRAMVLAHKDDAAVELFDKSRTFYTNLPEAVRPKKKLDNRRQIRFGHNQSSLSVQVARKGGGRAFTAEMVHLSEFAHMEEPEHVLAAVMDTVPRLTDTLIVIESTPNGVGNVFHDMYVNAKSGRSDWVALFFPWFEEPEYRALADFTEADLDDDERELVRRHGLSLEQLAWRRAKIRDDYNGDAQVFLQEHPSDDRSCFLHSGRPLFDKGLDYYEALLPPATGAPPAPDPTEFQWAEPTLGPNILVPKLLDLPSGRWLIYREVQRRMLYAIGADCAAGITHGDYSPLVVVNRHTLDVDATFYDKLPADVQAQEAMKAGWYYNEALLNWEANHHGIAFGMEVEGKYHNIFWRRVAVDDAGRRVTDRMGFETTPKNRTAIFDIARKYVREHSGLIRDRNLIEQMGRMVYDDRDRPDHQRGGYSDLVVAFVMALIAHKGDADSSVPLVPLTDEQREQAIAAYQDAMAEGREPSQESLLVELSLTADELLTLDNERQERKMYEDELFGGAHL